MSRQRIIEVTLVALIALLTIAVALSHAVAGPMTAAPRCIAKVKGEMGVRAILPTAAASLERRLQNEAAGDIYDPGKATFMLKLDDEVNPYSIMSLMVDPGDSLPVEALLGEETRRYAFIPEAGTVEATGKNAWEWTAPRAHGIYRLIVQEESTGDTVVLNAFVRRPFMHDARALNGYRIGQYPEELFRDDPAYARPPGFVEIRPEMLDLELTPHFRVRQFMSKQGGDWPQYLLVDTRLLLKLEMILEEVNEMGFPARTLGVLSGFRHRGKQAERGVVSAFHRWAGDLRLHAEPRPFHSRGCTRLQGSLVAGRFRAGRNTPATGGTDHAHNDS